MLYTFFHDCPLSSFVQVGFLYPLLLGVVAVAPEVVADDAAVRIATVGATLATTTAAADTIAVIDIDLDHALLVIDVETTGVTAPPAMNTTDQEDVEIATTTEVVATEGHLVTVTQTATVNEAFYRLVSQPFLSPSLCLPLCLSSHCLPNN